MQASHVILAVVAALCLVVVNQAFTIPSSYMQYVPSEYRSYASAYMNGAGAGGIPAIPSGLGNYMNMIPGVGGAAGAGGIPKMPAGMGNYMSMIPGAGGAGGAGGGMFGGMMGAGAGGAGAGGFGFGGW